MKTLWNETLKIWVFGLLKIPLVAWLRPRVVEISDDHAIIKVRLTRRTKNHVGSMYFGALVVGAEITPGIVAIRLFNKMKANVSFVFSDFHATFLKRAQADVYFTFNEGSKIAAAIDEAVRTKERQNAEMKIVATCPSVSGSEPIANFSITISLKAK